MQGIVGISVVKNESDIIEAMIRNNLRFLDALIVVDNNSGDATRKILNALAEELPDRLFIRSDGRIGHLQQRILNKTIKRLAIRHPDIACFVPLNGDELIHADPEVFRTTLLTDPRPLRIPWTTYVPTPDDPADEVNPVVRIGHRREIEEPRYHKITFPRDFVGKTILNPGSHRLKAMQRLDVRVSTDLQLAHFPLRSKQQLWSKIVIGSLNLRLRARTFKNEGANWHELADQIIADGGVSDELFYRYAAEYAAGVSPRLVHDPLPLPKEVRLLRHQVNPEDQLAINLTAFALECVRQMTKPAQKAAEK